MPERVAITSVGIISSLGSSLFEIAENIINNNAYFEDSGFDDSLLTCPVKTFNEDSIGRFKNKRYLNRGAMLCVASAIAAVKGSGLNDKELYSSGLFVSSGPNLDISGEIPEIVNGEISGNLPALWMLRFLPNTPVSAIAQLCRIHGENFTINAACASSLQAIGEGFRKIRDGYLNCAFCGGGDSRLSYGGLLAYKKAGVLHEISDSRDSLYSPFDSDRRGFVPGEGGAFLLLENMKHAIKRNATIYGEVIGYGNSVDGFSMTMPEPEGKYAEIAVRNALSEAGMKPEDIDVVSAHGTGTVHNDTAEAKMLNRIFSSHNPLIIAIKSWIGHTSTACGAIETLIGLSAMNRGVLPEIRNLRKPCDDRLNLVLNITFKPVNTILFENFGFGGQNAALIIKKYKN